MTTIKKIGAVLATIIIAIIKLPTTCISVVVNGIEIGLVTQMVKLAKVIDCEWWKEGMYEVMGINSIEMLVLSDYFDDLQEDLA